jgi:hypothetical protein
VPTTKALSLFRLSPLKAISTSKLQTRSRDVRPGSLAAVQTSSASPLLPMQEWRERSEWPVELLPSWESSPSRSWAVLEVLGETQGTKIRSPRITPFFESFRIAASLVRISANLNAHSGRS